MNITKHHIDFKNAPIPEYTEEMLRDLADQTERNDPEQWRENPIDIFDDIFEPEVEKARVAASVPELDTSDALAKSVETTKNETSYQNDPILQQVPESMFPIMWETSSNIEARFMNE